MNPSPIRSLPLNLSDETMADAEDSPPLPHLPACVLEDVLYRLPLRSLGRFTTVCKSWYSLIRSTRFIKAQINQSNCQRLLIRFVTASPRRREQFHLCVDSPTLPSVSCFRFPLKPKDHFFRVIGSCNGLICLSNDFFRNRFDVILWNPLIKKYLRLGEGSEQSMFVVGFGCDVKRDCKLVKLSYGWSEELRCYHERPEVQLYDVTTGSWRAIMGNIPSYNIVKTIWYQVFLKGSVHWIAYRSENLKFKHVILAFDMTSELFKVMPLPDFLVGVPHALEKLLPLRFSIGLYRDMISLFFHEPGDGTRCTVLGMKDYGVVESWEKLFVVYARGGIGSVVWFRNNGEVILENENGELVSSDETLGQNHKLPIRVEEGSLYVGHYTDGLVLLDGLNCRAKSYIEDECLESTEEEEEKSSDDDLSRARTDRFSGAIGSITPLGGRE